MSRDAAEPPAQDDVDHERVERSVAGATVLDRDGYPYVVHPLTDGVPRVDPRLLIDFAEWAAGLDILRKATVLLAPEAMGIHLAAATSMLTGVPFLVVRKREYGLAGETIAYCETGYGESCLYVNGLDPGDRVVIIEDVVSTGGTLTALLDTLGTLDVDVLGAVVFMDKGGRAADIAARSAVPVHAMVHVEVDDGAARLAPKE